MKNVPEIRFRGFDGEWEEKRIGDFISERIEKTNDIEKFPLYSLTIEEGVVPKTDRYEREFLVKKEGNYKKVYKGDFVYNPMNLRFGALSLYNGYITVSVSGYYNVFYFRDYASSYFWNNYLKTDKMFYLYNTIATGSLEEKKRVHYSQFKELKLRMPSNEEQVKIATFLTKVDKLIEKQDEKVKNYELYKRGMMQKIFSQEIRFRGDKGEEYPEWEEKRADKLFRNISDKSHNGELKVLSVTQDRGVLYREDLDIDIKYDEDSVKNYKRVKPGDFIISLRSFQGGFELTNIDGLISPAYTVFNFIDKNKFNAKYFGYIFKSKAFIRKLSGLTYGIRDGKAISFSDFSTMKFNCPCLEEQNKIANFFYKIDRLIEKEKEKLGNFKSWKKGLLQGMFV